MLRKPNSDAPAILARVVEDGAVVPALWHLEVGNTLLVAERRGSIAIGGPQGAHLRRLAALPIVDDLETSTHAWRETMEFAQRHR